MTKSPAAGAETGSPQVVTTLAATPDSAQPNTGLNGSDQAIAGAAIRLELALRDLYATAGDDEMYQLLMANHEAFGTRIAGIAGTPSNARDESIYGQFSTGFLNDPAANALEVENLATSRFVEWGGQVTDTRLVSSFAAIAIGIARQAALVGSESGWAQAIENTGVGGNLTSTDGDSTTATSTTPTTEASS